MSNWGSLIPTKRKKRVSSDDDEESDDVEVVSVKTEVKKRASPVKQKEVKKPMTVKDFFARSTHAAAVPVVPAPPGKAPPIKPLSPVAKPRAVKEEVSSPVRKAAAVTKKPAVQKVEPKKEEKTAEVKLESTSGLAGKTIVFTGNLSIDREKAIDLVVAAGGKVTSAVSGKTSFLVVGSILEDGRPIEEGSKFRKTKQLESEGKPGPRVMTEAEFFEIAQFDAGRASATVPAPLITVPTPSPLSSVPAMWVDKYEPRSLKEFVGNGSVVNKLVTWLTRWTQGKAQRPSGSYKPSGFPGRSGGNVEATAVLLSGPPGIGKSLLAKLACRQVGLELLEYNASDYRSKAAVDAIGSALGGSSVTFAAHGTLGLRKLCLVMDEVDGMSSGDRGGNQQLIQVIKKSAIPIICICNDRMSAKVRSLANHCYDLKMAKPTKAEVMQRAKQVLAAEKVDTATVPEEVIAQIIEGADCDIRQTLNQLEGDSFDWTSTVRAYEKKDKSTMLTAFEACRALLAKPKEGMSVNDRLDMFFVDYDLIPLLVQQNYTKCFTQTQIGLMARSAHLIAEADVISRTIRAEQNWGLLPAFGLIGSVFVVPPTMEEGYSPFPEFPSWLGRNSTTRKSARIAQELTCVISGVASTVTSRNILLSNYPHALYGHFTRELTKAVSGKGPIELPTLDALGVAKSDLMELLTELLLPWQPDTFSDETDSKTKAAITRICNTHHMALKSGGAHFRHLKSTGGSSAPLSLSLSDERGSSPASVEDEEGEAEEKPSAKESQLLVKQAKFKKPTVTTKKKK